MTARTKQRVVFFALLLAGLALELALKRPLYADRRAIGIHAVSLLIPFVTSATFVAWSVLSGLTNQKRTVGAALMFVLLALPFFDVVANPIVHLEGDDSYRYSLYAQNMLRQHTLWGSDQLFHTAERSRVYLDQPGYRYYLAGAITALGGEHRGLQLANMAVVLATTVGFLNRLVARAELRLARLFAVFFLATAPYAAKNILYGYSEWLAVALFIAAGHAALRSRYALMLVLIALVPFVRQNLLIISLIVAIFTVVKTERLGLMPLYVAVLALPVYHNLYYARDLQFFVERTGVVAPLTGRIWLDAIIKLGGYLGYMPGERLATLLIAVFFAPLGTLMIFRAVKAAEPKYRVLLLTVIVAAIGPTLVYGSGSYPRFEYVNLSVILVSFVLFSAIRQSRLLSYNDF